MWIGSGGRSTVLRICRRATWLQEGVDGSRGVVELEAGRGGRVMGALESSCLARSMAGSSKVQVRSRTFLSVLPPQARDRDACSGSC